MEVNVTCHTASAGEALVRQKPGVVSLAIMATVVALFCSPLFFNLDYVNSDHDWIDNYAVRYAILRGSLLQFHEVPFWSPFVGGDTRQWAIPTTLRSRRSRSSWSFLARSLG